MKPQQLALSLFAAWSALAARDSAFAQTWTLTSASTNGDWLSVVCSADGSKMAAAASDDGFGDGGPVCISTNSGTTWMQTSAPSNCCWQSVAFSINGSRLVAAVFQNSEDNPGLLYVSTNSGGTWKAPAAPSNYWACVASSADGARLAAADSGSGDGLIYSSTNAGATWTATAAPINSWASIASSADGSKLAAAAYPGGIYTWQSSPILSLMLSGGYVLISWQNLSSATGLALQANSGLTTANWVNVTNPPALTNGLYQMVFPRPLTGNQFYRLKSQ